MTTVGSELGFKEVEVEGIAGLVDGLRLGLRVGGAMGILGLYTVVVT